MAECIVDKRVGPIGIDSRKRLAVRIPSVLVEGVIQYVPVRVIASSCKQVSIRAGIVAWQPGNRSTLGDIAKSIVGKSLCPKIGSAVHAVDAGDSAEIVRTIGTRLNVGRVEGICNRQLSQTSVRIPCQG